jgi:hypothetical protein
MDKLQIIVGDYQAFLRQILQEITAAGFDLFDFAQMDHMCYRVASLKAYEAKKRELTAVGKLLGEVQVNNRPIATFRLNQPVLYKNWRIDAIELPAPKPGTTPAEGLEHVELVLFDDQEDFLKKYAGKKFELKAADRSINAEIGFKLPSFTVKFHLLSLTTVLYLQKKLGIDDVCDSR